MNNRPSFTDMIAGQRRTQTASLSPEERAKAEANFVTAGWRSIGRHPLTGRPTISFNTDNGPIRFHLDWSDAYHILSAGLEFWFYNTLTNDQSARSSGNPQSAGLPQDGHAPEPPTKSSSACCGEKYESSASSSNMVTHLPFLGWIANIPQRLLNSQNPFIRFSIGCANGRMVRQAGRSRKDARPMGGAQ